MRKISRFNFVVVFCIGVAMTLSTILGVCCISLMGEFVGGLLVGITRGVGI